MAYATRLPHTCTLTAWRITVIKVYIYPDQLVREIMMTVAKLIAPLVKAKIPSYLSKNLSWVRYDTTCLHLCHAVQRTYYNRHTPSGVCTCGLRSKQTGTKAKEPRRLPIFIEGLLLHLTAYLLRCVPPVLSNVYSRLSR